MESGHHIVSIDLGFAGEATALAVVKPRSDYFFEQGIEDRPPAYRNYFDVVHLERFAPGAGYPEVVRRTKEICSDRKRLPDFTLLINTSTSGPAPLKLFRERRLYPYAFTILNGPAESWQGETKGAPKRTVIGTALGLLQAEPIRLRFAKGLDLRPALRDELKNFHMKPPRVDTPLEAARENPNDDLVFAMTLAVWWGDGLAWNEEVAERMMPADDYDAAYADIDPIDGY